ncbi:recombination protein O N-terminal domain-containing protein [Patescibacteria group bacterium]|nr:recombination protein O N-terminal domain-containing protein [Patescibacteria group bacterium]MBU1755134.1 recombination protein O N-terminal domain-containing protein [Patescibacteria group bacterium]
MRHKYVTPGIVLARNATSEASSFITVLTPDLGVLRAKAQGIRKPGAKLAPAVQTLSESDISLVRGKEGWRLAGAILTYNWFQKLEGMQRIRAGRVANLLVRLVPGQMQEPELHQIYSEFLRILPTLTETQQDAAECLAALRILRTLGLDTEPLPEGEVFSETMLADITDDRKEVIVRINRGITASGL